MRSRTSAAFRSWFPFGLLLGPLSYTTSMKNVEEGVRQMADTLPKLT
jgi:hypothetical protein